MSEKKEYNDNTTDSPRSEKPKRIEEKIAERRAYNFLVHQAEAKLWMENMINEKLPAGTANFVDSLRDGVYLCKLARVYAKQAIPKIYQPKTQQLPTAGPSPVKQGGNLEFMAVGNIIAFLQSCDLVKYPKIAQFETTDLWEKRNIVRVVYHIHSLAKHLYRLSTMASGNANPPKSPKSAGFGNFAGIDLKGIPIVKLQSLKNAGLQFEDAEIEKTKDELKKLEEKDVKGFVDSFTDDEEENGSQEEDDELSQEYHDGKHLKKKNGGGFQNIDNLADPSECILSGEGIDKAIAGITAKFNISAVDSNKKVIKTGGEHFEFTITPVSEAPGLQQEISNSVIDNGDGTYTCEYKLRKAGVYNLEIKLIDDFVSSSDEDDVEKIEQDEVQNQQSSPKSPEDEDEDEDEEEEDGSEEDGVFIVKGTPRRIFCAPGPIDLKKCKIAKESEAQFVLPAAGKQNVMFVELSDEFDNKIRVGDGNLVMDIAARLKRIGQEDSDPVILNCERIKNDEDLAFVFETDSAGTYVLETKRTSEEEFKTSEKQSFLTVLDYGASDPKHCKIVSLNTKVQDFENEDENQKTRKIEAGEEISLKIQAKDKFGNLRQKNDKNLEIFQPFFEDQLTNNLIKIQNFRSEFLGNGEFLVSFVPEKSGYFVLKTGITLAREENENFYSFLDDSVSFKIVDAGTTCVSNCTYSFANDSAEQKKDPCTKLKAGDVVSFIVEAKDKFGNLREEKSSTFAEFGISLDKVLQIDSSNSAFNEEIVETTKYEALESQFFEYSCENIGKGKFKVDFNVKKSGSYNLNCFHKKSQQTDERSTEDVIYSSNSQENLKGFPIQISVEETGIAHPKFTKFEGDGILKGETNQLSKFVVILHDKFGNRRTTGNEKVEISLVNQRNPNNSLKIDANVQDLHDGSYVVSYLPLGSGKYTINVEINGEKFVPDFKSKKSFILDYNEEGVNSQENEFSLFVEPSSVKDLKEDEFHAIQEYDLMCSVINYNSNSVKAANENSSEYLVDKVFETKQQIVKQIRTNNETEKQLKNLDKKIQLLIKNRMTIDELIMERKKNRKKLLKQGPTASNEHSPAKANTNDDISLENLKSGANLVCAIMKNELVMSDYSSMFYLLQTNPSYLSKLLANCVSDEMVDNFLETVILTLFGYAFSSREEYLLLKIFERTLEIEVSKFFGSNSGTTKKITSFFGNESTNTSSNVIPKMVMTYGRRDKGQNFLKKILYDKILYPKIISKSVSKDLNLELNAVKILKEIVAREEVKSGRRNSKINFREISHEKALKTSFAEISTQETTENVPEKDEKTVFNIFDSRISKLCDICDTVLQGMIQNIDYLPYGLRYICKTLANLLKTKNLSNPTSDSEIASVIGYLVYYRFMNPVICAPDAFFVKFASNSSQSPGSPRNSPSSSSSKDNYSIQIPNETRNNLVMVSKVLSNLVNNNYFDVQKNSADVMLLPMNEWLKKNRPVYIEKFYNPLINVKQPEEQLGVHPFSELTQKKAPLITITFGELISTHKELERCKNLICESPQTDSLYLVLQELQKKVPLLSQTGFLSQLKENQEETEKKDPKSPKKKKKETKKPNFMINNEDLNLEINLPLVNKFKGNEIEKNLNSEQILNSPQAIYEKVKDDFRFILKIVPKEILGDNLVSVLNFAKKLASELHQNDIKTKQTSPRSPRNNSNLENLASGFIEKQQKFEILSKKIENLENSIPILEKSFSNSQNWSKQILIDIIKDIQNDVKLKEQHKSELNRSIQFLAQLLDYNKSMEERIEKFEEYIEDVRKSQYETPKFKNSSNSSTPNSNSKTKKSPSPLKIEIQHQKTEKDDSTSPISSAAASKFDANNFKTPEKQKIVETEMEQNSPKKKFKFSFKKLKEKGVIIDIATKSFVSKKMKFLIEITNDGKFIVEARHAKVVLKTVTLVPDELMELQENGEETLDIDGEMKLNVRMLLNVINTCAVVADK